MKKLLLLLMIAGIPLLSIAGNPGEIQGTIQDSITGDAVIGANVFVKVGGKLVGTTTDLDGKFSLKPLEPGYYDLNISYIGYKKKVIGNVRVNANKITFLGNVSLSLGMMKEVVVEAFEDALIKPEDPSAMTILEADIKTNPANKNTLKMVSTMVPGVYQQDDDQPLYFRGSRSSAVQYIVDGMKVRSSSSMNIPSSGIGEITVYTSGLPAKYGDTTGGVIVIETKSYFSLRK